MIVFSFFCIGVFIGIVRFLFVKIEAQERFARYEAIAKVVDTSYGKVLWSITARNMI